MTANKKILVIEEIEDDALIREILHKKFAREGFSVLEAKDGESGLAMALSLHPDLILLDIVMPKMDGLAVMKKLREADGWGKNVPIILFTNQNVDDDKILKEITDNKPTFYLEKLNYTPSELVEKVKELIYYRKL